MSYFEAHEEDHDSFYQLSYSIALLNQFLESRRAVILYEKAHSNILETLARHGKKT